MQRRYRDRAGFLTVYIKEAHPTDEWQMKVNEEQGVCYPQPRTLAARVGVAGDFVKRFDYDLPLLVDRMDNRADELYGAWPERLYILDARGVIVYKGKLGPFGFKPEEVAAWLDAHPGT